MARFEIWQDEAKITSLDMGECDPGGAASETINIKNVHTASIDNSTMRIYPEKENWGIKSGSNILSAEIIRETTQRVLQKGTIEKEDTLAVCTLRNARDACFLYNGVTWTDYSTGAASLMANGSSYFYALADEKYPCLLFDFATLGSYTGWAVEYWNGSAYAAITGTDGTSGATSDGVITLASADLAAWTKATVNTKTGYPLRFSCTGVTTQAVTEAVGGLYWAYVYDLNHSCLVDDGDYYTKSDDATPLYSGVTPDLELPGVGRIAFNADPLSANPTYEIVAEYLYKTPQPGTYEISYPSTTSAKYRFEGGSWSDTAGITADGETLHTSFILGLAIIFRDSDDIDITETTEIEISETPRYMWLENENKDYNAGTIAAGDTSEVTIDYMPPMSVTANTNSNAFQVLVSEPL